MPSGNQGGGQGQNQGRKSNDGNSHGGGNSPKEVAQNLTAGVQQGVEQASQRLREGYGAATEHLGQHYRAAEGTIARNPSSSVLVGFGLGFGIGLALTAVLVGRREEDWVDRYVPDSLAGYVPNAVRNPSIPRSVRNAEIPDSVHHTLHSLSESLRDLPATLSKLVGR